MWGKKQVHFGHPGWEHSKFCVPLTTPHVLTSPSAPRSIVLQVSALGTRQKLPATPEGKQMLV